MKRFVILLLALMLLCGTALADTFPAKVTAIADNGLSIACAITAQGEVAALSEYGQSEVAALKDVIHIEVDDLDNSYWLTAEGRIGMNDGVPQGNDWLYEIDDAVQISVSCSRDPVIGGVNMTPVLMVLHADGTVTADNTYPEDDDAWIDGVSSWKGVKQIANCQYGLIGLKADGAVYYLPAPGWEAYAYILDGWQGITQLRSDDDGWLVAGYRADGSCVSTAPMYGMWYENFQYSASDVTYRHVDAQLNRIPPITGAVRLSFNLIVSTDDGKLYSISLLDYEDEEWEAEIWAQWCEEEKPVLRITGGEYQHMRLYADGTARCVFGDEELWLENLSTAATYEMETEAGKPLSLTLEDVPRGVVYFSGDFGGVVRLACAMEDGSVYAWTNDGEYRIGGPGEAIRTVKMSASALTVLTHEGHIYYYTAQNHGVPATMKRFAGATSFGWHPNTGELMAVLDGALIASRIQVAETTVNDKPDKVIKKGVQEVVSAEGTLLALMKDGTVRKAVREKNKNKWVTIKGWKKIVRVWPSLALRSDGTFVIDPDIWIKADLSSVQGVVDAAVISGDPGTGYGKHVAVLLQDGTVHICTDEGMVDTGIDHAVAIFVQEFSKDAMIALHADGTLSLYHFPDLDADAQARMDALREAVEGIEGVCTAP